MTIQPVNTISQTLESLGARFTGMKARNVPDEKSGARVETSVVAEPKQEERRQAANLEEMARELTRITQRMDVDLSFSVDHDLNKVVVTVTRSNSSEVVLQIPSEEVLALARRLREMEQRGDAKGALLGMTG